MYTSTAAAHNANPILTALRTEVSGATPQAAHAIVARWLVDLTAVADLRDDLAAPIRHALRVLRLLTLGRA